MTKKILIDAVHPEDIRAVVLADNNVIEDFDVETTTKKQNKGNIYLAKVMRIEPSIQAAFVDYGNNKNGFLQFSEIHPSYFQIPAEDKSKLLETALQKKQAEEEDEDKLNADNEIKNLSEDDEGTEVDVSWKNLIKKYKIQEVIKPRQVLLVQVVKEERGNKGASLTTYISLAGKYNVLMPNSNRKSSYGISRKIFNYEDRKRIREILKSLDIKEGMTVITRTAGLDETKASIAADYEYLLKLWSKIVEKTMEKEAPALIWEEGDLIKRVIRDMAGKDIEEIIIQGDDAFNTAKTFYKEITGKVAKHIKLFDEKTPIFIKYNIEKRLSTIHDPVVYLKSGGSIVLNQTEALVAIDVNSGRSTKEKTVEETALKTNLEAAEMICRQLRLRDLAGIIVIDFIDMEEEKNNHTVENRMKECLKADRAKIAFRKISHFGLMELSRQRLRSSFIEASYLQCPHCKGSGIVPSVQTAAVLTIRNLEEEILKKHSERLFLTVPNDVALYLLNQKREDISQLEQNYQTSIIIAGSNNILSFADRTIERMEKNADLGKYFREKNAVNSFNDESAHEIEHKNLIKETNSKIRPALPVTKSKEKAESSFLGKIFGKSKKEEEKKPAMVENKKYNNNGNNNNNKKRRYYHNNNKNKNNNNNNNKK